MSYAELAVTTNFSFLRGASHPQEFVTQAQALGYAAIGIADRNSLAGVVRAYGEWKEMEGARPQLLVGARLVFRDGTPDILAYPKNRKAYGRLSRLLSIGKLRAQKGECLLDFADLLDYRRGLQLIVMPPANPENIKPVLARLGPNTWLAASMLYTGEDRRCLRDLAKLARTARVPLIAVNDALYHHAERRQLQDVVTCIREHVSLKDAGKRLEANAERHLKPPKEMPRLFRDCPEAVAQTLRFARGISFTLAELGQRYPREPVPRGKTADQHLRDLTQAGLKGRYPQGVPQKIADIAEKSCALSPKAISRIISSPCTTLCGSHARRTFSARAAGRPPIRWSVMPSASPPWIPPKSRYYSNASSTPIAANRPTLTWISSMSGARKSFNISTAATVIAVRR